MGVIHLVRTQNFSKTNISYPLIHTRMCVYQGVEIVSFLENLAYMLNECPYPNLTHLWNFFLNKWNIQEESLVVLENFKNSQENTRAGVSF